MNTTALTEEQQARAAALDTAAHLITGQSRASAFTTPTREGLIAYDLPNVVRLAQYVLTGKFILTEADRAALRTDLAESDAAETFDGGNL